MNSFQQEKIKQRLLHHDVIDEVWPKFCCKYCDSGFSPIEVTMKHEQICKLKYWPKYMCYVCDNLFNDKLERDKHEYKHSRK